MAGPHQDHTPIQLVAQCAAANPGDSEQSARNPHRQGLTQPAEKRSIFVSAAQSAGLIKTPPVKQQPGCQKHFTGTNRKSPPSRSPPSYSSGLYCPTQKYTASSAAAQGENTTRPKCIFTLEILRFTKIFNTHHHWCPHLLCMSDGQECQGD